MKLNKLLSLSINYMKDWLCRLAIFFDPSIPMCLIIRPRLDVPMTPYISHILVPVNSLTNASFSSLSNIVLVDLQPRPQAWLSPSVHLMLLREFLNYKKNEK